MDPTHSVYDGISICHNLEIALDPFMQLFLGGTFEPLVGQ